MYFRNGPNFNGFGKFDPTKYDNVRYVLTDYVFREADFIEYGSNEIILAKSKPFISFRGNDHEESSFADADGDDDDIGYGDGDGDNHAISIHAIPLSLECNRGQDDSSTYCHRSTFPEEVGRFIPY